MRDRGVSSRGLVGAAWRWEMMFRWSSVGRVGRIGAGDGDEEDMMMMMMM
jgi:hypothetical protein